MEDYGKLLDKDEEIMWKGAPGKLEIENFLVITLLVYNISIFYIAIAYSLILNDLIIYSFLFFFIGICAEFFVLKKFIFTLYNNELRNPEVYLITNKRIIWIEFPSKCLDEEMVTFNLKGLNKFTMKRNGKIWSFYFSTKKDIGDRGYWISFIGIVDFKEVKAIILKLFNFKCELNTNRKKIFLKKT